MMPEASIEHAIARGLLKPEDRAEPWAVIQACYASWLSEPAMRRLIQHRLTTEVQRGDTAAMLRSLSDWLDPHKETAFGT